MKDKVRKFLALLLGIALGCIVSLVVAVLLLRVRAIQLSTSMGAVPTAVVATADPAVYNLLAEADQAIQAGNPQKAIDLILPKVDSWSSPIDKGTGYQLLAVAEVKLNHPQEAIPYAQKMTQYSPGSFSYQLLAQAYDLSGDLRNALSYYQQMMMINDNDSRSDFAYARSRIISISQTLGTPVPKVTTGP